MPRSSARREVGQAQQLPADRSCRQLPPDVRGVQRSLSWCKDCGRRLQRRFRPRAAAQCEHRGCWLTAGRPERT
ncbi:hypothetical protein C1H21_06045 [Xanthomonas arboricola pv. juglandis]|nr:hypothetical protein C1H21_06045 [Xanthomonas arboricola pv. juglandis]